MTEVWMYSLASSSDPDRVSCVVPWRVDEELIFFGPCKTRIRERLRKQYLSRDCSHRLVSDEIFIVGVNGSNSERTRKIVWTGKLREVMTFAEANDRLRAYPDNPILL